MPRTIDNFDQIKSQLTFGESDNLFLHLQILRRGKDHPDLPAANKLMKSWLVRSREHLDSLKDEVVFLCEHYGARAYISCVPKSIVVSGCSMRINLFADVRKMLDNVDVDLSGWKVKHMEWIKDCPVPVGEDLRRINNLFT